MRQFLIVVLGFAAATSAGCAEPQPLVANQVRQYVAHLAKLHWGEERTKVVEAIVALGDGAKPALRDLARTTTDSRTVTDVADVAARLDMADVADIYLKRLAATDPDPPPEYLCSAIVRILGEPNAYRCMADLAMAEHGTVRRRVLHAIGYSGYSNHNPLPTLDALAARLDGEDCTIAHDEMCWVLEQNCTILLGPVPKTESELIRSSGLQLLEPPAVKTIAEMVLGWIVRDRRFDGTRPGEAKGRCPYPADGRHLASPFGVAFENLTGGYRCFVLAEQGVAEVDPKDMKSTLFVEVHRKDDFASVSFFDLIGSEETRTIVLLRKLPSGWAYGGYMRTDRSIICFDAF